VGTAMLYNVRGNICWNWLQSFSTENQLCNFFLYFLRECDFCSSSLGAPHDSSSSWLFF